MGILKKALRHDAACHLETSGLRMIFLRKIIVTDGFRICHSSIFIGSSSNSSICISRNSDSTDLP